MGESQGPGIEIRCSYLDLTGFPVRQERNAQRLHSLLRVRQPTATDSPLAGRIFGPGVHNLVKDGGSLMANLGSFIVKSGAEVSPQVRSMSLKQVVGESREADSVSTV